MIVTAEYFIFIFKNDFGVLIVISLDIHTEVSFISTVRIGSMDHRYTPLWKRGKFSGFTDPLIKIPQIPNPSIHYVINETALKTRNHHQQRKGNFIAAAIITGPATCLLLLLLLLQHDKNSLFLLLVSIDIRSNHPKSKIK
jgi:hypothetical protein